MNRLKTIRDKYSKTVGERTEIDDITTPALILQRLFGQQVLDPNWTWKRFALHHSISLLIFIYVFFGTLEILKTTDDPEMIAEACYTLIMIIIFPLKFLLFVNNRVIFRELFIMAKTNLLTAIKEIPDSNIVLAKARKVIYVLFAMVLIPVSTCELTTVLNYIQGHRILLSRSTATLMPMTSPYYELAWILHSIFLIEVSTTIILDMWFVLLIYLLCAASDSLVRYLEVEWDAEESSESYGCRLNAVLRRFYDRHVQQVRFLTKLNEMYKWLAFVPLCNAALCICIILLLMSKEVNWGFAPHVLPMFAEIFAYNYFGEQIKTKAAEINRALLNFDWSSMGLRERKSYFVIITYIMKKDFGIKTAVGSDLSLITMTAVLKASYQAFTVLQSIGD